MKYKLKSKCRKNKKGVKKSKKNGTRRRYGGNNNTVYIYTCCYNESVMLPLMVNHYKKIFTSCEITIYDNNSTDNTAEVAKSLGCKVIKFDTTNETNNVKMLEIKNNCWKEKKNSWVIVCDVDEFLCITQNILDDEYKNGVTILRSTGYNIIGDSKFEDLHDINVETLSKGIYDYMYNKNICFYSGAITEMNYTIGGHEIRPVGTIKYSDKQYLLKHISWPGLQYRLKRNTILFDRSHANRGKGWGVQYKANNSEIETEYNNNLATAKDIKPLYQDCFNEL